MTVKIASDFTRELVNVDSLRAVQDTRVHRTTARALQSLPIPPSQSTAETGFDLEFVSKRRLLAYLKREAPVQAAVSDGLTYHCIVISEVRERDGKYRVIYEDWAPSFVGTFLQQHRNRLGIAAELYRENGRRAYWSITEDEFFRLKHEMIHLETLGGDSNREINPIETNIERIGDAYFCHVHSRIDFTFLLSKSVPLVIGNTDAPKWRLNDLASPANLSMRLVIPPPDVVKSQKAAFDIDANLLFDYSAMCSNAFRQKTGKLTAESMRLSEDPLGEPYLVRAIHAATLNNPNNPPKFGRLDEWDLLQISTTCLHSNVIIHFILEASIPGTSLPPAFVLMHRIALSIMRENTGAHKLRTHWENLTKSGKIEQFLMRE
jgi:hypothetical protein